MRNCSLLEEKGFLLILSSVESILFRNDPNGFRSKEESFILRSLEKNQKSEFFNRRILSVEIKNYFYFKMTAQNPRTLKLI